MYEDNDDNLQPFFDSNIQGKLQLQNVHCDSSILSLKTNNLIKDLAKLLEEKDIFDFQNFAKDYLLYCEKTDGKGKFNIETHFSTFLNKFSALRSKPYAFIKKLQGDIKNARKTKTFGEYVICPNWDPSITSKTEKDFNKTLIDYVLRTKIFEFFFKNLTNSLSMHSMTNENIQTTPKAYRGVPRVVHQETTFKRLSLG